MLLIDLKRHGKTSWEDKMKYKVHRFDLKMDTDKDRLEQFLNSLEGEIVSIVPNVKPTLKGMGATATVDFLLIVEKLN
jgi:hypothetical protein